MAAAARTAMLTGSLAFLAAFPLFALAALVGTGGLSQARRLLTRTHAGLGTLAVGLAAALRVSTALGTLAALARLLGGSGLLGTLVLLLGVLAALATALARLHAATLGLAFLGLLAALTGLLAGGRGVCSLGGIGARSLVLPGLRSTARHLGGAAATRLAGGLRFGGFLLCALALAAPAPAGATGLGLAGAVGLLAARGRDAR